MDKVNAKIAERKARRAAAAGAAASDAEDQSLFEPSSSLLICSNMQYSILISHKFLGCKCNPERKAK